MPETYTSPAAAAPPIRDLQAKVEELLQPRLGLVLSALEDHLFNLSSSSQLSADDRTRCFDAFTTIKGQQKLMLQTMNGVIREAYDNIVEKPEGAPRQLGGFELDLIDIEEFEDSLAIDKIVKAGSERYWLPLEALALRVAKIIDADPSTVKLPFGVKALCSAYRGAVKPLGFKGVILNELDRAFARNLLPELSGIYKEINHYLAEQGLLPEIEAELEKNGSKLNASKAVNTPAPQRPAPAPEQPAPDYNAPQQNTREGWNTRPASAPGFVDNRHEHRELQRGALEGGTGEWHRHEPPARPRAEHFSGGQLAPQSPPPQISRSELDSVAASIGQPDYLPGRGANGIGTTVDQGVLERLQSGSGYSNAPLPTIDPQTLAEQSNRLIGEIAGLRRARLSPEQMRAPVSEQLDWDKLGAAAEPLKASLQMVDALYQTLASSLTDNQALSDSINQLKLPLTELSLHDPTFYMNREHPARLLVERLTELSAMAPANNRRLEQQVSETLESLSENYNGDLNQFDSALSKVTDLALNLLKQQQRNIQRQVAAEEGREKRQRALKVIETRLLATLNDVRLPKSILKLVDDLWRDMLVLLEVREPGTPDIDSALVAIKNANEALLAASNGADLLSLPNPEEIAEALWSIANRVAVPSAEQEAIIAQIESELEGETDIELADSSIGVRELFAEPEFSQRLQSLTRLKRWVRAARELPLNTWLRETTKEGTTRNLQLIWANESKTRFALSNERGQKVRDTDLLGLARWLSKNLKPLAPSEQLSIIERSVFSTLADKQSDLIGEDGQKTVGLSRADLDDRVQTMLRRARRKGATGCAVAIHANSPQAAGIVLSNLQAAGISISAEGKLSETTRGAILENIRVETLQRAISDHLNDSEQTGISIAPIDTDHKSAESLWQSLEETAKRGLAVSPNAGVVAQVEPSVQDLAGAVRNTYARLQEDMPPRVSFRHMRRQRVAKPSVFEDSFHILLDGEPEIDTGGGAMLYSASLAIALDCLKISSACRQAEQIRSQGKVVPIFNVRVATESALHHEFLDFVLDEVSKSGVGTDRICIEFRDSTRLRQEPRAADFARTLRSIGCQIAVCSVNPSRGSTSELQNLSPHLLTLDESMWPPRDSEGNVSTALHQTISDLHHLVGEHVVLPVAEDYEDANALGIDFMASVVAQDITGQSLFEQLPQAVR